MVTVRVVSPVNSSLSVMTLMAAAVVLWSSFLLLAATGDEMEDRLLRDRIVAEVDEVLACRHVAGMAMTVVHGDRVLIARGFGSARLAGPGLGSSRPVTDSTKFIIASLSKSFTATLVGILLKDNEKRLIYNGDGAPFSPLQTRVSVM